MAGSLDDSRTLVLSPADYEYLVISAVRAEVWVSPRSTKSRADIAAELRRVADYVEASQ